ncbi:MAG: hypothetical protein H6Q84_1342 [Deltaproteobacteria bacterium]|nr:hypothetical protein [Deltaproteobacteria bacterium]
MGKTYRVYRVDFETKTKTPIGTVQDRRSRTRGLSNIMSLTKLAWKIYAQAPEDQFRIVLGEELIA